MKKFLFVAIVLMVAMCAEAQLQHKLVRYYDNYDMELMEFIYSPEHVMIATHTVMNGTDGYEVYDSLRYDALGNLTRMSGWQRFPEGLRNVYYLDYTYDEFGRVLTRKNFNLIKGEWQQGGLYEYEYDEYGFLSKVVMSIGGSVYQKVEYENGADGVVEALWSTPTSGSNFEPFEKMSYRRVNGRVVACYDSLYESGWAFNGRDTFTLDAEGNCLSHVRYDKSSSVVERNIYTIDSRRVDECLLPWTPEMADSPRPKHLGAGENVNVYTTEEYWTLDADFVLQHLCDYTYEYVGIIESGVEDVVAPRVLREVRKVMVDGVLYVECDGVMWDVYGRRVR